MMPKNKCKVRLKGVKVRRWAKGHSSDCNPEFNKHRLAAIRHMQSKDQLDFNEATIPPDERLEQCGIEEQLLNVNFGSSKADDMKSQISALTKCTNATFSNIFLNMRPGSITQSSVVSTLAGVTDFLAEKGLEQDDLAYFGALMAALPSWETLQNTDEESFFERLAGTSLLLARVIAEIEPKILKARFSQISDTLTKLLTIVMQRSSTSRIHYQNDDKDFFDISTKYLTKCLCRLLQHQESSIWDAISNQHVLRTIATLACTHRSVMVRYSASKELAKLIDTVPGTFVPAKCTGEVCIDLIKALSSGGEQANSTLICCTKLLQHCMHRMPATVFVQCMQHLLTMHTLDVPEVRNATLKTITGVLLQSPSSKTMPVPALIGIANVLMEQRAHKYSRDWMQAVVVAQICLFDRNAHEPLLQLLPQTWKLLLNYQLAMIHSDNMSHQFALQQLQTINQSIVEPFIENDKPAQSSELLYAVIFNQLDQLVDQLSDASQWHFSIVALADMLTSLLLVTPLTDLTGQAAIKKSYSTLLNLHGSFNESNVQVRNIVESSIADLAKRVGVEACLRYASMKVVDNNDILHRSWMLPVLSKNITRPSLKLFATQISPLSCDIKNRLKNLLAAGRATDLVVKYHMLIEQQLWDLLPPFCSNPTDLVDFFAPFAKLIYKSFNEEPGIRSQLLAAVRNLVKSAFELEPPSPALHETVAQYSSNFLILFFGHFLTEDDPTMRLHYLETIRLYMTVGKADVIDNLYQRTLDRIEEESIDLFKRERTIEILVAFAESISVERVPSLLSIVNDWLESDSQQTLKRALRALQLTIEGHPTIIDGVDAPQSCNIMTPIFEKIMSMSDVPVSCRSLRWLIIDAVVDACSEFQSITQICDKIWMQLIDAFSSSEKHKTKVNATKLMKNLTQRLIDEEKKQINDIEKPAYQTFSKLIDRCLSCRSETMTVQPIKACEALVSFFAANHCDAITANLLIDAALCVILPSKLSDRATPSSTSIAIRLLRATLHKTPSFISSHLDRPVLAKVFALPVNRSLSMNARHLVAKLTNILMARYGKDLLLLRLEDFKMSKENRNCWYKVIRGVAKRRRRRHHKENDSGKPSVKGAKSVISTKKSITTNLDDLLRDSDDEGNDGMTDIFSTMSKMSLRSRRRQRRNDNLTIIDDADGEPLDLLETSAVARRLLTSQKMEAQKHRDQISDKLRGMKLSKDGKLCVVDDSVKIDVNSDDERDNSVISKKKSRAGSAVSVKRARMSKSQISRSQVSGIYRPGGGGIHRSIDSDVKSNVGRHSVIHRSKKTIKKKSTKKGETMQPYAYVQLPRSKKKQQKFKEQVKTVKNTSRKRKLK